MSALPVIIGKTNDQISEHFQYHEVVDSYDADRQGIDNQVYNPEFLLNAKALAENVLEKIRAHFFSITGHGVNINSWYRCEALEHYECAAAFVDWCKQRGIDPNAPDAWFSYFQRKSHPAACAADIHIVGVSNQDVYNWISANLEFDQLILEFVNPKVPGSGWVHVSWNRFGHNRKQSFSIG